MGDLAEKPGHPVIVIYPVVNVIYQQFQQPGQKVTVIWIAPPPPPPPSSWLAPWRLAPEPEVSLGAKEPVTSQKIRLTAICTPKYGHLGKWHSKIKKKVHWLKKTILVVYPKFLSHIQQCHFDSCFCEIHRFAGSKGFPPDPKSVKVTYSGSKFILDPQLLHFFELDLPDLSCY